MKLMRITNLGSVIAGAALGILALSSCSQYPYHPTQFIEPKINIPTASPDSLQQFLKSGSHKFKLAFIDKTSIRIIDFSQPLVLDQKTGSMNPLAIRLQTDPSQSNLSPSSPLISSDGNLVTYYFRNGNAYVQQISDSSAPVLVAENGSDPHFWDSAGSRYIIYSNLSVAEKLDPTQGKATFRRKIDPISGSLLSQLDTLSKMPFNGGLCQSGRYLCTGYKVGAFFDRWNSNLLLVNYSGTESQQICNPSISPAPASDSLHQDWMLFLNIGGALQVSGYASGWPAIGAAGEHSYLVIADSKNTVQWYIKKPDNHYEWQCPEWTNKFDYIAALLVVTNSAKDFSYDCYIIRLSDQRMFNVTSGSYKMSGTATPSLWIGQ
jgi:hypothetical protein